MTQVGIGGRKLVHKLFTITAVLCLPFAVNAQKKEVFTTNDFRIVDGKLYNIKKSTLWREFEAEVIQVRDSGVIVQPIGYTLRVGPVEEIRRPNIWLTNAPSFGLTDGKRINFLAMRTGTIKIGARTMESWDCGLPNTQENRQKLRP